jgi:NADH:ubiquinone oxidoreductase subunit C
MIKRRLRMGLKKLLLLNQNIYLFMNTLLFVIPKVLDYIVLKQNQIFIYIKSNILGFLVVFLKYFNLSRLESLIDLIVVDYPDQLFRFKLIYNFFSYKLLFRVLIVIFVKELQKIFSIA